METDNLYKNIFMNTQDAILIADDDGNYIDANPAAAKLFGYTIEELCTLNVGDITPEQNIEESLKLWKEFIKTDSMEGEFEIRKKNGELRITHFRAIAKVIEGRHVSVMRDITERKTNELELTRSTEFLNRTGAMARVGGWEVDLEKNTVYWTNATHIIHEVPLDYTPSMNEALDFFHGESKKRISDAVSNAIEKGEDYELELEFITAKNKRLWGHAIGKSVFEKGKCIRLYGTFQDITERKLSEEAIKKSKQDAEKYLNIAAEIIIAHDQEGNITLLNESGHELLGYNKNELIGKNWFQTCLPKNIIENVKEIFNKIMKGKGEDLELVEGEILTKSGEIKTILWHNSILNEDGEIIGTLSSGEDISDKKMAEKQLEKSEKYLKNIISSMSDGFSILDVNGIHIDVNPAFCKMTGFSREEIIGTGPPHPYWPAEEYKHIQEAFSKTSHGILHSSELIFKKKNGERFPVIVSPSQLKDREGNVISNFATIKDITDRKEAEKALKESEERLSSLYNSMTEGVCLHEIIFDESGKAVNYRILDANPIFEEIIDIERSSIIGMLATEAYKIDKAPYLETYASVARTNEPIRFETYFPPMKKHFSIAAYSLGKNKFATVFDDITERKKNEAELEKYHNHLEHLIEERTRKLESANRELREFTYSVSHDLRAPLRSIMGFSEIISKRHRASLNEEGVRYFDFIMEASNNMSRLIEDLLQYSRLGKKENQMVNLKSIIENVLLTLEKDITELDAEIILPKKFPAILSSRTLIEQIVFNLVSNSLKYHSKGIKPKLEIAVEESPQKIIITVKDNGIGIQPEYQDKIFNIFQRLHSDADYPGTGVGLAIVKKSAAVLNGKVWLESALGKGSTFFVELPIITEN